MGKEERKPLPDGELGNQEFDETKDDNSKNKGSSEVEIKRKEASKDYGRTTDTLGAGHEPGTTPGKGF